MSKFNLTLKEPKTLTTNLAGGQAYTQSHELELISILLNSFVDDQFYRSSNVTLDRLKTILDKVDPKFAAKAAIFARDKFGMRSITHALAGELTSRVSGQEWSKDFYDKVVVRVDDMTEIMSYYLENKTDKIKPKFPNSLKKGFASAFNRFDSYQLAKYKSENKEVKLIDIVNLVHPVPTPSNKEALSKLVLGDLKSTDTWESKLSKAGQDASNSEELSQLKSDAWGELLTTKKIGYFALLRNLRNIINQAPQFVGLACDMLVDEKLIKSSRILPFRFSTAYEEISKLGSSSDVRMVMTALHQALDISAINVPKFDGDTLVVLDVSGSMSGRPSEIASLFGSMLAKANNCDVMTFATSANYKAYNPMDSIITIRNGFRFSGGGTNFKDIFLKANKKYDRVIILSDMQGWIGKTTPASEFNLYKKKFNCNPYVYSWDLSGLGTMQLPEQNVFALAGFSDKVFDIMQWLETDKNKLYEMIDEISI
jgi:60 kDa SS-A/Ro ribonucleoprotein